jgi:circadian clock protein KaiB
VIDLIEHLQLARGDEIVAVPTVVRKLPEPIKKLIGDLSTPNARWSASSSCPEVERVKMPEFDPSERFAKAIRDLDERHYVLRLYVVGATPQSQREICETELGGRYELEVIDIYQQPMLGAGEQIIAAPTLIKELLPPVRRLVGDMSDRDHVLLGLDLEPIEG